MQTIIGRIIALYSKIQITMVVVLIAHPRNCWFYLSLAIRVMTANSCARCISRCFRKANHLGVGGSSASQWLAGLLGVEWILD